MFDNKRYRYIINPVTFEPDFVDTVTKERIRKGHPDWQRLCDESLEYAFSVCLVSDKSIYG